MKLNFRNIEIAAANKKMSIKEILQAANMSPVTLKRIKDDKPVKTQTAGKLAEVLNVNVTELL